MNKKSIFLLICFSLLVFTIGCGGSSKSPANPTPTPTSTLTSTPTPTPTDPELSPSAKNLIRNGDFELELAGDEEGWGRWGNYFYYWDTVSEENPPPTLERCTDPEEPTNHILHFYALDCGVQDWHQQVTPFKMDSEMLEGEPQYFEFELKTDKDYFISLKARSDKPGGRIYASLNDATTGNFEHYGGYLINTTTVFTTYTNFIMKGNGKKVRFSLNLGNDLGVNTNNGVNFYIDEVKVLEQ